MKWGFVSNLLRQPQPVPLAAFRLRQPLVPIGGLPGAEDEILRACRERAVESVENLAVRQCLLELLHAFVRDLGAVKEQGLELVQPLEIF